MNCATFYFVTWSTLFTMTKTVGKVGDQTQCDRGLFHKTLWIRKLRICNYGQILTVNLLVNCQNSVIYGHFVVNYLEKSFMEQAADV